MKKNHYPTAIALAFFAGTFLMVFTTNDSDQAAARFISYLIVSCGLAVATIYWDTIKEYLPKKENPTAKFDEVLSDAEKFSEEYGEVYVLADKLKKQKKGKKSLALANKKLTS